MKLIVLGWLSVILFVSMYLYAGLHIVLAGAGVVASMVFIVSSLINSNSVS